MKTRIQLSDWALWVYDSKWLYGMGCYGQRLQTQYATLAKSWYYTSKNPSGFKVLTAAYNAGLNPRLYDCHGIVDGFRMDDGTTAEIDFDPALDISADMEFYRVKSAGQLGKDYGTVDGNLIDNRGYGYWRSGHFGVGVGDGQVVDIWNTGYPARKRDQTLGSWTYWVKCYGIDYSEQGEIDMLQKGDKGLAVTYWQKALLKRDPASLPRFGADSDFGGETETATKAFQTAVGLSASGMVDTNTFAYMANALIGLTVEVSTGVPQADYDAVMRNVEELTGQLTTQIGICANQAAELSTVTAERDTLAGQLATEADISASNAAEASARKVELQDVADAFRALAGIANKY